MKKQITILALTGMVATLSACSLFGVKPDPGPASESNSIVTSEPAYVDSYVDVKAIVGQWDEMDVLDSRLLTINEDGTYSLEYRGGGTSYGTISVDFEEHPDGSVSKWYSLYDSNGDEFAGFCIDEGETFPYDLYSGQDGEMHFSRVMENQGSNEMSALDYVGTWSCGSTNIVIEESNDTFNVDVSWAASPSEHSYWHYTCYYNAELGVLESSNGVRTNTVINENGTEEGLIEYEGGVASFSLYNGCLVWVDQEQSFGDGLEFFQ